MAFPMKAVTNLTTNLGKIAAGTSDNPKAVHFVLARVGGPTGAPRLAFFKRSTEATEAKLREVWKGDKAVDEAEELYIARGAVRILPSGMTVVPATRGNKALSGEAMKEGFRAAKKGLTGQGIQGAVLQSIVDARVERASDTAELDTDGGEDDEEEGIARDSLKLEKDVNVKNEAAKQLRKDWNKLHDEIEEALEASQEELDEEDRALVVKTLAAVADKGAKLQERVQSTLEELEGSLFSDLRFSDSKKALRELDARIRARLDEVGEAYRLTAGGKKMTFAEQKMVPSAKDLDKVRERQEQVHIKRKAPEQVKDFVERDKGTYPNAKDKELGELLKTYAELATAVDRFLVDDTWEDLRKELFEYEKSGELEDNEEAKEAINMLSDRVETLDDQAARLKQRAGMFLQKRSDLDEGDPNFAAALDLLDRCDKVHADLQDFQRELGTIRLTPSQAWALVGAEMQGESTKDVHLPKAKERWKKLIAEWNVGYDEDDLDEVMDYIRDGGALKIATQYRLEKPISVNDGGSNAQAPKNVPLAKLIMQSGFRNMWETGVSQASASRSQRGGVEERMGYQSALKRTGGKLQEDAYKAQQGDNVFDPEHPEEMPRYAGLVSEVQTKGVGTRYGSSYIIWKDEVHDRVTHTPGDSWNTGDAGVINFTSTKYPEPLIAYGDPINIRLIASVATGKDKVYCAKITDTISAYVETQIHGDLGWEDVEAVVIDKAAVDKAIKEGTWDGQENFADAEDMKKQITDFVKKNGFDIDVRFG